MAFCVRWANFKTNGASVTDSSAEPGAVNMPLHLRHGVACMAAMTLWYASSLPAGAQSPKYTINMMPPGGPAPRLTDGHPDLSGHWLPNGAGQGVSGRYGVDPAALGTFDPKVT